MSARNDGGPVYPCDIRSTTTGAVVDQHWGISLRDYFAAKAMASLISPEEHVATDAVAEYLTQVAEYAYAASDAMLAERTKEPPK